MGLGVNKLLTRCRRKECGHDKEAPYVIDEG